MNHQTPRAGSHRPGHVTCGRDGGEAPRKSHPRLLPDMNRVPAVALSPTRPFLRHAGYCTCAAVVRKHSRKCPHASFPSKLPSPSSSHHMSAHNRVYPCIKISRASESANCGSTPDIIIITVRPCVPRVSAAYPAAAR